MFWIERELNERIEFWRTILHIWLRHRFRCNEYEWGRRRKVSEARGPTQTAQRWRRSKDSFCGAENIRSKKWWSELEWRSWETTVKGQRRGKLKLERRGTETRSHCRSVAPVHPSPKTRNSFPQTIPHLVSESVFSVWSNRNRVETSDRRSWNGSS